MIASMGRKGDCSDNAVAERFFRSLKTELTYHYIYATRAEARRYIIEYIEMFYNSDRLHPDLCPYRGRVRSGADDRGQHPRCYTCCFGADIRPCGSAGVCTGPPAGSSHAVLFVPGCYWGSMRGAPMQTRSKSWTRLQYVFASTGLDSPLTLT